MTGNSRLRHHYCRTSHRNGRAGANNGELVNTTQIDALPGYVDI
ncbi:MAG: hypothetical protein M5U34_26085 [Chloroflexi bacterium]|nr:hypothetical protein [Chloroflexota bacterium]